MKPESVSSTSAGTSNVGELTHSAQGLAPGILIGIGQCDVRPAVGQENHQDQQLRVCPSGAKDSLGREHKRVCQRRATSRWQCVQGALGRLDAASRRQEQLGPRTTKCDHADPIALSICIGKQAEHRPLDGFHPVPGGHRPRCVDDK